jgi:hypothetical protein
MLLRTHSKCNFLVLKKTSLTVIVQFTKNCYEPGKAALLATWPPHLGTSAHFAIYWRYPKRLFLFPAVYSTRSSLYFLIQADKMKGRQEGAVKDRKQFYCEGA